LRNFAKLIVVMLVAGLAWTIWAAAAFYDLAAGLQTGDVVTLERRVDWSGVRSALREDLQASPVMTDEQRSIDTRTSERGIAALLRAAIATRSSDTAAQSAFDWHHIRYAFYAGSPLYFRIDLQPDAGKLDGPLVLLFRWTGDWRLVRIFVPAAAAKATIASQRPSKTAPLPPGAQRAILFEELPNDQHGKRTNGSVTWRVERTPPVAGGAPDLAVTAEVKVPDHPLAMTMTIRRNTDASLPASHTLEINFTTPPGSSASGIGDVLGVMMKPDEEAPGQHLAGSRAKVRDGFFMLGLSSLDIDVRQNMDLLKGRPWFGLPIRTNSGRRAVLAIEKGDTGEKVLAEAFAQWDAPPAPAAAATAQSQ
jgi:hypothetical protein